jgi:hypothetical protein
MTGEEDRDLPLHDEAEARSGWRDGETILDRDEGGTSGPASEVDDDAQGGGPGKDGPVKDFAQRPPD